MSLTDKCGFKREAIIYEPTWPSTSPALITDLLPMVSMQIQTGVTGSFQPATDADRIGFISDDLVSYLPTVGINCQARYQGFEELFACALGLEARWLDSVQMPEEIVSGKVWRHLFEVDHLLGTGMPWDVATDGITEDDITTGQRKVRRGTIAVQRDAYIWEFLSGMTSQLSIGWDDSMQGHINLDYLPYNLVRNSAVNTTVTLAKAMPNVAPTALLYHSVCRVAPYSAVTPLDDGDRIRIKAWSVTLQNILQVLQGPRTGYSMEEPERGSGPGLLGSFNVARYTDNIFVDAWPGTTRLMMDMKFTGPLIPGTNEHYQLNFYVPGLYVTQSEPTGPNPYRANVPVQWFGTTPSLPAAGFPVSAKQGSIIIETVNGFSAHSLL